TPARTRTTPMPGASCRSRDRRTARRSGDWINTTTAERGITTACFFPLSDALAELLSARITRGRTVFQIRQTIYRKVLARVKATSIRTIVTSIAEIASPTAGTFSISQPSEKHRDSAIRCCAELVPGGDSPVFIDIAPAATS